MATSTGVGTVASTAMAIGGNGGNASSGPGGLGGNTMATATSVGNGAANATATADGGNGSLRSIFGSGIALASATGTSGSSAANALSAGGMLINLESHATAPVSGLSRASARAGIAHDRHGCRERDGAGSRRIHDRTADRCPSAESVCRQWEH